MTDLTTLDAAKLWASVTGNASDPLLSQLITAYSEWVRSFTNLDFDIRTYTISRSGRGQVGMQTPQFPIVSVNTVTVDGISIPAQTTFGGYGFRFDDRSVILDGACFTRGRSNVVINYTAGYATIPTDIAQAVNELVAMRFKEKDRIGFVSKTLAGEVTMFSIKDMPSSVQTVLKQYTQNMPL